MADPLLLYSVNTWLSYVIAEQYYDHQHYVWCTPYFDRTATAEVDATTPPTSTPFDILHGLDAEVRGGDRHSAKIADNKVGVLRGATYKRTAGVISEVEERDIGAIVDQAETRDFHPLLYIIPYEGVKSLIKGVPINKRAHPLSIEYIIESLPRALFDVIKPIRRS
jgi:hypothetical protein